MPFKALLISTVVATALNAPLIAAEHPGVPHGWTASEAVGTTYQVGYDSSLGATYLSNGNSEAQIASLMQTIDGKPFRGHYTLITAEVRDDNFQGEVEMFLRGIGEDVECITTIDPQPGIWQKIQININLNARDSAALNAVSLGFAVQGKGKLWFRNLQLRVLNDAEAAAQIKRRQHLSTHIADASQTAELINPEMHP